MSHYLVAMLAAVVMAAADQVSKAVALARWPPVVTTARPTFVAIRCLLNRRGALVPFLPVRLLLVLWAGIVVLAVLALANSTLGQDLLAPTGIGMVVGGATGNLVDRLRRGAIVDFIAIGPWPVFNLGDAAIVAGAGLILLSLR